MVNSNFLQLGTKKSCIRDLFEFGLRKAAEIGKENVYDFSIGNPSVPAPEALNEAIREITHGESLAVHGYTPAPGDAAARTAVAEDLTNRSGMQISASDLFFTCGAAPALCSVLDALNVPGSEVMGIAPFFAEYRVFAEAAGHKFVVVPADEVNFQIDINALASLVTANTQAIIVNSPNNPSGVIYSRETLEAIAAVLRAKSAEFGHPIYIIADEPYRELAYDGAVVEFIPNIYENTVVCYSYSKSLSIPGDRLGYFCIPACVQDRGELFAAAAGAARARGHVCAPALMQKAVAACTELRPDIEAYDRNRKLLYSSLTEIGYECVYPQGAFYMFVKAPGGDAQAFSDAAKEFNLLLVPGADFGCPGFFRLCTCVSYDMAVRSLPAFKAAFEQFR